MNSLSARIVSFFSSSRGCGKKEGRREGSYSINFEITAMDILRKSFFDERSLTKLQISENEDVSYVRDENQLNCNHAVLEGIE